jgi:hypothetical protein
MKVTSRIAVGALALGLSASPVVAEVTGNNLLAYCTTPEVEGEKVVCLAYIDGVAATLAAGATVEGIGACFTRPQTTGQLRDIAVKWLREHPQRLNISAAPLVVIALALAFPCRN